MYIALNQSLNCIPYKHHDPFKLCELMCEEFPDDYYAIHPVETIQQQFTRYSTPALQELYNTLGFPHTLDRATLVTRLCEFCYWADESVVTKSEIQKKRVPVNKKLKNISLRVLTKK